MALKCWRTSVPRSTLRIFWESVLHSCLVGQQVSSFCLHGSLSRPFCLSSVCPSFSVRNRQSVWVFLQNLHALKDGAFHSWVFFWRTVCRRFLQQHEEYRDRLYEVEAPGSWTQRRNIWLNIQLGRYTLCKNVWLKGT